MDLNLLTALDALLEEGSVTGAAERLHVSTPAMSRTLGRLRRALGDPILVRTGRSMTPTPRALALRPRVGALLLEARGVLSPEAELDPRTLRRTFTLRWHDSVISGVAAPLTTRVRREAPGVLLRFLAEPATDGDDLRRGLVDLEAGGAAPAVSGVRSEVLGVDELVVVMRAGHPLSRGDLTADRFVAAEHVTVSRRGRLHDRVDDVLERSGLTRRVVVAVPTAAAALALVGGSDLVAVVPGRANAAAIVVLGLVTGPLPIALPPVPLHLSWHRRNDDDRAHTWLRDQVRAAALVTGWAGW